MTGVRDLTHGMGRRCAILLPILTSSLTWGRFNVLAAMFFSSLSFLVSSYFAEVFVTRAGLQKKIAALLSLTAPAVTSLVTMISSFVQHKDTDALHNPEEEYFCGSEPRIESEISTFVHHIVQNYILFWYRCVSPDDEDFVHQCSLTFEKMFVEFSRKEMKNVQFQCLLANSLTAVRNHVQSASDETGEEAINSTNERAVHLMEEIAEYWLNVCGPDELNRMNALLCLNSSGQTRRDSVYVMVREMLTFGVLMPIASHLSDPRLLFRFIVSFFSPDVKDKCISRRLSISDDPMHALEFGKECNPSDVSVNCRQQELPDPDSDYDNQGLELNETKDTIGKRVSYDDDTGLEKGVEVTEETDARLFEDIRISETRIAGKKGDFFVEYKVTYSGLYEVMENIASTEKTVCCLVRQEVSVWRRFSGFVALHQSLDGNRLMRQQMRHQMGAVVNPVRLKTVSSMLGSKLSRTVTMQRSMSLVRYLQRLSEVPVIANSPQFREFMAYDSDSSIRRAGRASGKSSALRSLLPSRLDKVITGSIRGAVSIMKNVIPIDSYQDGYYTLFSSSTTGPKIETTFGDGLTLSSQLTPTALQNLLQLQAEPSGYIRENSYTNTVVSLVDGFETQVQEALPIIAAGQRQGEDECVTSTDANVRCADLVIDILALILRKGKPAPDAIPVFLLKSLCGDFFEKIVEQVLNSHCNEETAVILLHSVHHSIWSTGSTGDDGSHPEVSADEVTEVIIMWIESKPFLRSLLPPDWQKSVSFTINCLQDHHRNLLLLYELIGIHFSHLRSDS